MRAEVLVKSVDDDQLLNDLTKAISEVECGHLFPGHLGKPQYEQKAIVKKYQDLVLEELSQRITNINWSLEHSPSNSARDSIDIYGSNNDVSVAIELDKFRADQVAKKFVSRSALLISSNLYFVSLCYPGTERMNKSECIKYFNYCSQLSYKMGDKYAGLIVG